MARIFLSHSSRNNADAVALRDWLIAEGWDDLFLDLDPSRGIAAGERWERRLYEASNRCEAVLFLVSRPWLKSEWCLRELTLAEKLNKRIFGVLIEELPLSEVPTKMTSAWQLVDLVGGADHQLFRATLPDGTEAYRTFSKAGLARLKVGLTRAGLDARFFSWPPSDDPDRPPYRGMRPLESEDAGILFGREAPTIEALDRLRGMREAQPPRFLVILGASGAGKSSFLRAGLLPRLQRDDRNFLPLPIVRPERAARSGETGLIRSLATAFKAAGLKYSRAEVQAAVDAGAAVVGALLAALAEKVRAPAGTNEAQKTPPRVVLAIDQCEELFLAEGAEEAKAFLALVAGLVSDPASNLITIVTIRSDAYERLQTAPALEGVQPEIVSLPPLPRGAYQTVIEGPVARLRDTPRALKIEPALTAALLADIEQGGAKDALPLLAFTLERLYLEYGGDGDLKLSEYRQFGGIKGSIDAAVEGVFTAADADPAVPKERVAREAILRRALIPWLAGIDPETGAPRRRVARISEIPEEARPLVEHLIAARLLATDISPVTGERTIEPAHEALLRQWGLLQGWLEEDFAALTALEGVRRAARDWDKNTRADAWLAHTGGRLDDAEALLHRDDFARFLTTSDRDYLAVCRATDTARRDRELEEARKLAAAEKEAATAANLAADRQRQLVRRTRIGLIAATAFALVAVGAAIYGFDQARRADAKTTESVRNETVGLAALSRVALSDDLPVDALQLVLAAWPRIGDRDRPQLRRVPESLSAALSTHREQVRLRGHESDIRSATFSPDGTRVVTASQDRTARIFDAATGAETAILKGHEDTVLAATFSPDGARVLTASYDDTARIFDAATGAEIAVLRGHGAFVYSAAFSPDGARVVTASQDRTARIWDAATGTETAVLRGHEGVVYSAIFSPDGARVVTASSDNTARIWDAATGAETTVLRGTETPPEKWFETTAIDDAAETAFKLEITITSAAFSPDGAQVLTASNDKTARIWDASTGAEIAVFRGHEGAVWSAAYSPDGTRVVTQSDDNTARIFDAATGGEIAVLRGHEAAVTSAAFSLDGARVVTASEDRTARIFDATTGAETAILKGHASMVSSAAFSPDGARVVTASWDTARIFDAAPGPETAVLGGHEGGVRSAAFSPDGALVVTASIDKTARIFDAATGAETTVLRGHEAAVFSAAFSPDGARVVTASEDKTARIFDAATGAETAVLRGHEGRVYSAAFSPDGVQVLTASEDKTARIFDAATGAETVVLRGHEQVVWSAAFSPGGARVVTASWDNTARIFDAATGAETVVLRGHEEGVQSAAFSPDGARVVTASLARTAGIFDAATGAETGVLRGQAPIYSAAFSPDGARVVTASIDTARIFDAATGAEIAVLRGHGAFVYSAAFSPDGARVVTASDDRTARIWDISKLENEDAFAIACRRLGTNIDLAEVRARYGLGELSPICGDHPPIPIDWRKLE